MDDQSKALYELRFKTQFLEAKGAAFQDLFVAVMSKAHPADFIACRPWGSVGDRKNDGYLKSERTLFQVYAPNEMRLAETVHKIEEDFTGALPHWSAYFETWVFVHNALGGLSPDVIAKLLELQEQHRPIRITHWGFDELLLRFKLLSPDALRSLYGLAGEPEKPSEARRKLRSTNDLVRSGKHAEAISEMTQALALARDAGDDEEEVEILLALTLTSSDPRGRGDAHHYFLQAAKKIASIKTSVSKAIFHRARARTLEQQHDITGAEEAYRTALHICTTEPEDAKGNLSAQACVIRSSFVHLLCNQHRLDEAAPLLAECETYAREHKDDEDGELLQAALESGIHFSLEADDEDAAIRRITELEQSATSVGQAHRVGFTLVNVANRTAQRKADRAARAAAEAAVRLGRRSDDDAAPLLLAALYTEAMVLFKAGDSETALAKAEPLLDVGGNEKNAAIKQATQHLIAEIRRLSGDSQRAVDLARQALADTTNGPENTAFAKLALGRALNDNGQTEDALKHAKEAWILLKPTSAHAHPEVVVDILSHITNYSSQLGSARDLSDALEELREVSDPKLAAEKERAAARAQAHTQLRQRFMEILEEPDPAATAATQECASLQDANAHVVRPLLELWYEMPEATAESYDFWGRGNFARLLLNARRFPNSFNITLEVRTFDDVKRAIRLWGLYADFLILLWKGPTQNGLAFVPLPDDYEAPGGWGYIVAAGDVITKEGSEQQWHPAIAHISMFPPEVATFLATDARPFIESGRLVVVPAVGAGCINPGHGPFEQLLAEAANAIPNIRWKGFPGTPIGYIPHSPDAPFALLADVAEAEATRLRKLRLLLLARSRELAPEGNADRAAKQLALEIDDALRDMADRTTAFTRKRGLDQAKEPLSGGTARFLSHGEKLTHPTPDSPFAPLFILQSHGYGWRVDSPAVPKVPERFEPHGNDIVGTWLAPPSPGWDIPTAFRLGLDPE
ncbi:MAG: hypothetical protein ABI779_06445 [Acidobacteriota bacterium]